VGIASTKLIVSFLPTAKLTEDQQRKGSLSNFPLSAIRMIGLAVSQLIKKTSLKVYLPFFCLSFMNKALIQTAWLHVCYELISPEAIFWRRQGAEFAWKA
jgi:hypothetical protein